MDRFEPNPELFVAEPKYPPHQPQIFTSSRMLTPEELASITATPDRARYDLMFSEMQDRHDREVFWYRVETGVLAFCLIGVGVIGTLAFVLF